ncbi:hypothetical protein NPIL_101691 [Nephila pilipes]|uniref:C2H2-type domain-containing protein n=1 Tax=Nephila pilipes TaxID=299642 RepID=A0A8X6UDV2_NEPPI|nr:hypothetical protein NPIL_101691 [Nephila pilipes]
MGLRCDYCSLVFTNIKHYLRHKYIIHAGQELRRQTSDDRMTWQSFLTNFEAWSRMELVNRSTRRRVNTNESVEGTGDVINLSFGEGDNNQNPICQQVLSQRAISASVFDTFERHSNAQPSVQQVNSPVKRNHICVVSRCTQSHSCNPQMRPEFGTSETIRGIPHENRPSLESFPSHLETTKKPNEPLHIEQVYP